MRSLFKGLLATSCALAVVATGCSERKLRPLTPCTTAGVSNSVPIDDIKNVDLLFMVDDSGSMRQKQAKLRSEFPNMVRALLTGNTDTSTPQLEWPPVQSLRIAVVTSDMGVAGVGTTAATAGTKIATCGANPSLPGGIDASRAHYGDDGAFRLQGQTVRVSGQTLVNCDVNPADGTDDSVTAAQLPAFLTFDNMTGMPPDPTMLNEYVRRVSCYTNTGTTGCSFEQQLESMLKSVTPSDAASVDPANLPGGAFYHAQGEDARGLGQGTDTNTTPDDLADPAANGGWLRDDSLLAVVLVTDEDDCSSKDPLVFDFNSNSDPLTTDPYGRFQSQTRCARHPELTFDPDRYVQGLLRLRAGRERLLVFGAITGIPQDLTDGTGAATGIIEGTDNIDAIVADPRMQYIYDEELQPAGMNNMVIPVPLASLRPACQHIEPGKSYDATGDLTDMSTSVTNFVIGTAVTGTPISATGQTMVNGSSITNIMIPLGAAEIVAGMTISGAGVANGTTITLIQGDVATQGPFTAFLSQPTTAAASGVALTIGASYGPAIGQLVTGPGIPPATTIAAVSGTGPYTVTLSDAVTGTTAGATLSLGKLDASATPARRAALVGRGLYNAGANVTLQSICVDSFAPAMAQILRLIQSNLAGSCLPRPLNRNALNTVTCDVFVTLPPNVACADTPGMIAETPQPTVPTTDATDTDGKLERCRMRQVPVTAADRMSTAAPTSAAGWFYDDYTTELSNCTSTQRISFTTGALAAKPPQGAVMKFGCIQPVQDGNLSVDLNAACNASQQCPFPSEQAYDEFVLRYNLEPRGWAATAPAPNPTDLHQLQCEPNSLTCQVPCLTDANCPGGFVCFDQHSLDPNAQSFLYCVNPTCGSGQ